MSVHLFLTPDGTMQPRWKEAFPEAIACADLPAADHLSRAAVVWLRDDAMACLDCLARIRTLAPVLPIVVISLDPDQTAALRAFDAGARGYCHALSSPDMLRSVATTVTHGGLWIGPELMTRVIRAARQNLAETDTESHEQVRTLLTERERAVAKAVARGASNKEIARELDITERTVKAHLSAVFTKLNIRDRLQLALRFNGGSNST